MLAKKEKELKNHTKQKDRPIPIGQNKFIGSRIFGMFVLVMSAGLFVQALPLVYVFIGVYLGLPAEVSFTDMDTLVWMLTSISMMILILYAFITWMKFIWRRFVKHPKPFPFGFSKRKKKTKHIIRFVLSCIPLFLFSVGTMLWQKSYCFSLLSLLVRCKGDESFA